MVIIRIYHKKNLARKDGMLTAFLHLDMENLGGMDISISLQTERNQVTTKFYLEEHALPVIAGHIDDLTQRLAKKVISVHIPFKNMNRKKQ